MVAKAYGEGPSLGVRTEGLLALRHMLVPECLRACLPGANRFKPLLVFFINNLETWLVKNSNLGDGIQMGASLLCSAIEKHRMKY